MASDIEARQLDKTKRSNATIRKAIREGEAPRTAAALEAAGVDPKTLTLQNPKGVPQFQKGDVAQLTSAGKIGREEFRFAKYLDVVLRSPITKPVAKALPFAGAVYILFAPGEASAEERIVRAGAGEVGIGPFDLESAYDYFLVPTAQIFRDLAELDKAGYGIPKNF